MVIQLIGNWQNGRAFDLHTVSSTYVGVDEYGHMIFDTEYTEMGKLINLLKYKQDDSTLIQIVTLLDQIKGIQDYDYLIPIPPTQKNRKLQPVKLIAEALGKHRNVAVLDILTNDGNEELKGISDPVERTNRLLNAIRLVNAPNDLENKNILLIDDLYRSGTTLSVAADLLIRRYKAIKISVLTMTKTRSNQ